MSPAKKTKNQGNFTFVDIRLDKSEVQEAIALSADVHAVMSAFEEYLTNGWVISFKPGKRSGTVAAYLTCTDTQQVDYHCSCGCFTPHIRETWALLWVKLEKAQNVGGLLAYHTHGEDADEKLYG